MSDMTFSQYQRCAKETAVYPEDVALPYLTLGLIGEAGEVANKYKKVLRGDDSAFDPAAMEKELGDILWYVAMISSEFGLDFGDVASKNIKKLASRKKRGTLKGTGDNR